MKYSPFIAPILVVLYIGLTQTFANATDESNTAITPINAASDQEQTQQLAKVCYKNWQALSWKLGQSAMLAQNNPAFSTGIMNICQARAELFFEGYQINPFIAADSQQHVYPIVFRSSVEEIKSHLQLHLPKLNVI